MVNRDKIVRNKGKPWPAPQLRVNRFRTLLLNVCSDFSNDCFKSTTVKYCKISLNLWKL